LLAVLPALLAFFPAVLPRFSMLLALLPVLLALLPALPALFLPLLTIPGLVAATTALALTITLAPGSVSASAVPASPAPAWLVASVTSTHVFLLVLSIDLHDSVSCTRSGIGVTPGWSTLA
jgi:hypothetical protein